MGFIDELRGAFGGAHTPGIVAEGQKSTLDIVSAIEAHVRWKMRLEGYINGTSGEALDAAVICKDDQCVLGKWIHGEGHAKYGDLPLFQKLTKVHADFHRAAADVVRCADGGDPRGALEMLQEGSYARCSYAVKTELARLCRTGGEH